MGGGSFRCTSEWVRLLRCAGEEDRVLEQERREWTSKTWQAQKDSLMRTAENNLLDQDLEEELRRMRKQVNSLASSLNDRISSIFGEEKS